MKPLAYRAVSEINVANFVDVMLVLLIVFMITAPLLQSGIDIDLPKTEAGADELSEGLIVTIDEQGAVFLDDIYTKLDDLDRMFQRAAATKADKKAFLRADQSIDYGTVVHVLSAMRSNGFADVGLVTEPEDDGKSR